MRQLHLGAAFALILFAVAPAWASEYLFSARIDQANSLFAVGTTIEGRFGYDPTILPSFTFPYDSGNGAQYERSSIFIAAEIGGDAFSSGGVASIVNDGGSDGDMFGVTGFAPGYTLQLNFDDPTAATFANIGLPTIAFPSLAQGPFPDSNDDDDLTVPSAMFSFYDTTRSLGFDATVLSITPASSPAPEPGTWAMFILGFGLVGNVLRSRRNAALRPI